MITLNLKGGLCNQLFQIFAVIAYSIQYKQPFVFPFQEFLTCGLKRPTYWNTFLNSLKQFTIVNPRYELSNSALRNFYILEWSQHEYKELPPYSSNQNVMFDGYFQSYKYFENYQKNIFSLIRLESQQNTIADEFPIYCKAENTYNISMHFRLGDYKYVQHSHNLLPIEYYQKSLEYIVNNLQQSNIENIRLRVLFFCEGEDNEHVFSQIIILSSNFPNIEFLKVDDSIPDWKQLLIMSLCDSNIIANSTFSWWGAYFGNKNNRIITYPSQWFGPVLSHNNINDMFPLNWIKIDI